MTKGKQINLLHTALTVFVFLAPVLGSGLEKSLVLYASLCAFSVCIGYRIFKDGYFVLTKTFLFQVAVALFAFVQLCWVSDKGCQIQLGTVFLLGAAASLVMGEYKTCMGKEKLVSTWTKLIYSAALIYAIVAVLYQVFIESSFWSCNMDFGAGSSTAAACLMAIGVISAMRVFKTNKKQPVFFASTILMTYVFVMTKSFPGYAFCTAVLFVYAMKQKHKKAEALGALILTVVLSAVNGIFAVANIIKNPEELNGAIKGLVNIAGVGAGGYNAAVSIVDRGYEGFSSVLCLLLEAFGIIGVAVIAISIICFAGRYIKTRSLEDAIMLLLLVVFLLSSSSAMVFMIPILGMFSTARDEAFRVDVHKAVSLVMIVPVGFCALFALAHVPYFVASNYHDSGNYGKSASWYSIGAQMELFNAHGWEQAYAAYEKEFEETGISTERSMCLKKALSCNPKDYMYLRQLSDVYTDEGDYLKALETWDTIILRHDKEYLYPMYGEKIYDVMANCPVGLEKIEELYNTLDSLAKKATDKAVVLQVNNILARSQQYYINAREGTGTVADMYTETTDSIEVEYASGNTES